jgi:hypothetical protein
MSSTRKEEVYAVRHYPGTSCLGCDGAEAEYFCFPS